MLDKNCGRRKIRISLLGNIQISQKELIFKWIRGISLIIFIISLIIYLLKSLFYYLKTELFILRRETKDHTSSDKTNKNYSFNFSYVDNNINNYKIVIKDKEFILPEKKYGEYLKSFNLTLYQKNKNKNKKEVNHLYELFKFNDIGEESFILIDYSSSLPHFPLFSKENDKCFIRGEIISRIYNIINLTCVDISGIIYDDNMNFIIRLSLLDKNSSEIKLYIFKEINVKNEIERSDGRHNIIIYENNGLKNNLRYCSKELLDISFSYANMPKNYIPIIEINWPNKTQYFCFRNIQLFYDK